MKNVFDNLHGFEERPHYESEELDRMFEKIACSFLKKKYGKVIFPISTDDLTTLIEGDVADLDQYADLSKYGDNVEGMTEFSRTGKPRVFISNSVHQHENRLRTTLAHEYGHVILHNYLFGMADVNLSKVPNGKKNTIYCFRDAILPRGKADWMEWQAGYASGALLMPKSQVVNVINSLSSNAQSDDKITCVMKQFAVSKDAATVRLKILSLTS
jgi:Zn-dependent peptidase ImmA (M78 family)